MKKINRAILWSSKWNRMYEYFYIGNTLCYRSYSSVIDDWTLGTVSYYTSIEKAMKDPNDRKRAILKEEIEEDEK